jgi:glycosyltransferase involved in cell wall biosynthesis
MQNSLVSICCTAYNHAKFISECLDGFLLQKTNFNFEVLIHDDASTDGTQDIIKAYQAKYPNIIKPIFQTDNQYSKGVKPFIKYLFPASQGKYIAMCEGDDYWTDPMKLQKQVDFLEENEDFVGVFHNTACIDERQLNPKLEPWRTYDRDIFTARDTIRQLSLFHTSSYCFRNLDFNFSLIVNPKISSGDMMLLGLISKYGKLKLLDKIMSVYRKNDGGVTSSESLIKYHTNRINLAKTLNHYFENKFQQRADQVIEFHKEQLSKLKFPYGFKLWRKIKAKLFNI